MTGKPLTEIFLTHTDINLKRTKTKVTTQLGKCKQTVVVFNDFVTIIGFKVAQFPGTSGNIPPTSQIARAFRRRDCRGEIS